MTYNAMEPRVDKTWLAMSCEKKKKGYQERKKVKEVK